MLDFNSLKNISFKFCFTKYLYLLLFLFCLIKLQFQTRAVENMFLKFVILFIFYFSIILGQNALYAFAFWY